MSGRCYACGDKFKKFFSGEKGCKNCGFEFCKKCISKKIAIPKLNNEEDHVCDKCYKALSAGKTATKQRPPSPPKAFKKRMEALEKKEGNHDKLTSQKGSTSRSSSANERKYAGMDPVDADLARRIDKLKEDREKNAVRPDVTEIESRLAGLKARKPEPPTEQEMRERLNRLKGRAQQTQKPQYFPPEKRTNEEQIVDLMDELFDEQQIEERQRGQESSKPSTLTQPSHTPITTINKNPDDIDLEEINTLIAKSAKELELDAENAILSLQQDKQLMARLKELKRKPNQRMEDDRKDTTDSVDIHTMDDDDDECEDENEMASKLIKQYLAEAKIDEEAALATSKQSAATTTKDLPSGQIPEVYQPPTEEEEFPWCCICNDDAKIRCLDCEGDLFCAPCFGEGHKDSYMKNHDFEKFTPKK